MIETYPNLQPAAADISIEFDELVVLGNESLLTQCFGNLLGNAVKFVAPGVKPRIRVWAEQMTGSMDKGIDGPESRPPIRSTSIHQSIHSNQLPVRIWVEDNGIGIPKACTEKIFRMFQRMHRENEYPGTGIGSSHARKAVERMGGRVGLESEPGQGSKFWIELPDAGAAANRARMEDAASESVPPSPRLRVRGHASRPPPITLHNYQLSARS